MACLTLRDYTHAATVAHGTTWASAIGVAGLGELCPGDSTAEGSDYPCYGCAGRGTLTLSIKIAQKPDIIVFFGPKALKYESFEGNG